MRALSYVRVSTEDQALGLSLEWQARKCGEAIAAKGWTPAGVYHEHASAKDVRRRPVLGSVLAMLRAREADALVVARLDRLTRHTADFYGLMDDAGREGWALVCLDPQVDMSHPFGRAMAGVAAIFAQLERELISQRQRDSVRARKAAGTYVNGNPFRLEDLERAIQLRAGGTVAWARVGEQLAREGRRPPGGGRWHDKSLARAVAALEAQAGPHAGR